jgi:hypothetical protein
MKTRKDFARLFLFIATVYWGIWLGGYLFNSLMLVPEWSHKPPESVENYYNNQHFLIYFFALMNPGVFLMSLIAWLLTIKIDTAGRAWLGRATLIAWIMFPLKVYMIIKIGGVVGSTLEGNFNSDVLSNLNLWKNLNWVTIIIGAIILILHLVAILNFNHPRKMKKSVS